MYVTIATTVCRYSSDHVLYVLAINFIDEHVRLLCFGIFFYYNEYRDATNRIIPSTIKKVGSHIIIMVL